jgi:hypothetical protein
MSEDDEIAAGSLAPDGPTIGEARTDMALRMIRCVLSYVPEQSHDEVAAQLNAFFNVKYAEGITDATRVVLALYSTNPNDEMLKTIADGLMKLMELEGNVKAVHN